MATLATLKFTDAKKPKAASPALGRRHKLSAKLAEQLAIVQAQAEGRTHQAVSYTHLTLPTIYSV